MAQVSDRQTKLRILPSLHDLSDDSHDYDGHTMTVKVPPRATTTVPQGGVRVRIKEVSVDKRLMDMVMSV
jgi:hypothetical protein